MALNCIEYIKPLGLFLVVAFVGLTEQTGRMRYKSLPDKPHCSIQHQIDRPDLPLDKWDRDN